MKKMTSLDIFIILQYVLWIIGMIFTGITLYSILLLVPIVMFTLRKFAVKVSLGYMVTFEFLFLFFRVVFQLLRHGFDSRIFIVTLILRIISVLLVVIDNTHFIYVTEERKRR